MYSVGMINSIITVKHDGKLFSLNDLYSQGHWSKRSGIKNKFRKIFHEEMSKKNIGWMNTFYLLVFYNSRHDVDNISGMSKVFVDTMKGEFVHDDDRKHYKGLLMFPVEDMPFGSVEFIILSKR